MNAANASAAPPVTLSRRRKILFAIVAFVIVAVFLVASVLALDIYLHHRVQGLAGLNVWGYRGPVVARKKPGERRIVTLGGSTVFGFGLPWTEAWPYYLEREINAGRQGQVPATVINLGIPADSAGTFVATMNDYAYMKYDVVILYEGYNDLGMPMAKNKTNPAVPVYLAWRHQSPVFRWTGYFPIFPLVLHEKAMLLMHGGDLNAAYGARDIVFRPGLAARVTAGAMKATADIAVALERRFGRLTVDASGVSTASDSTCGHWSQYCGAMEDAVRHAIDRGQRVLVVTQPYLSDLHADQQRALAGSLQRQFGGDSRVRYLDLGRLVDLRDQQMAYDGMHLTAAGNERVAAALAPTLVEMIK